MSKLEPVLRCHSCQVLNQVTRIHKLGFCSECGNRRFAAVIMLSVEDLEKIQGWGIDDWPDPIMRCPQCQNMIKLEDARKGCECGGKKFMFLSKFSSDELKQLEQWGMTDFLGDYEEVKS